MERFKEVLMRCPLFEGIGEEELMRMLHCRQAQVMEFDKKYTIMAEGSPAHYVGIVLTGSVQVTQTDFYGNRSILAVFEPGELFAEDYSCAEANALPVSVIAAEPCQIMLFRCSNLLHTCQNNCGFHQQLIYNLMKNMAQKALVFHRKLEILAKRTTREKLLAYLAGQAQRAGSNYFEIPFDRQELADYLEVDRTGLSAELGRLRREGVLDFHRSTFRLLR